MITLSIRTENPSVEVCLFNDYEKIGEIIWDAHRILADTIHIKIYELLQISKLDWKDISGIVCFSGPGSFTGLRIGITVGNMLAYGLSTPIVKGNNKDWQLNGIKRLLIGEDEKVVVPDYGQEIKITKPKK